MNCIYLQNMNQLRMLLPTFNVAIDYCYILSVANFCHKKGSMPHATKTS